MTQKAVQTTDPRLGDDIARILSAPPPFPWGRWMFGALVIAALAWGGWWYLSTAGTSGETVTYSTEEAIRGDLSVSVTATGTVQPTTLVEVSSELSGTLASVNVDYNDSVEIGQVLARLDNTKLAAQVANAGAQLASAKARLVQAEASAGEAAENLVTQQELASRGITTRKDSIGIEATNARAAAAVDIARADLTLAEANLALSNADLADAEIRSPIRGVVLNRTAEVGQIVAASLSAPILFTLAEDLTRMELLVNVDEADIGKVAVGQPAQFSVDAYEGQTFPAVLTQVRFASETTDDVVTYAAVLSVDNPGLLLRPGMTATAVITVAEDRDVLLVPNAALRFTPPVTAKRTGAAGLAGLVLPARPGSGAAPKLASGKSLWVLREGVPVEVAVTLGASDGERTVVTSEALVAGDLVIYDQQTKAK